VLYGLAAAVIFAAVGPLAGWWHYEVIESGSMTPALKVGGVAVVVPEPLKDVRAGQILAFHPPGMKDYVRIHRVISVTHRGDQVWIRTKGDANPAADPGPVRLASQTAYVERMFVPYVGYGGVWLYKHSTRTALEGVLFAIMVSGGLWLIWGNRDEEDERRPVPVATPSTWPLHVPGRPRTAGAHAAAGQAATATLVALNNLYTAEPPADQGQAAGEAPPSQASAR
jgi:signal peptidase I